MNKYDIGILGVWPGLNYGSVATYYALHHTLKSFGLSVLMVDKANAKSNDPEMMDNYSRIFAREHYTISKPYSLKDISELNSLCDTFIVGSDQLWNYGISKHFGKTYYLDFADDDKKKISYATSFGHSVDFAPADEQKLISGCLKRFDAISVREADGEKLCRDVYGVEAIRVLDPVFLCDASVYNELAEKSSRNETKPYILSYILDPTPEKREALIHLGKKLGCKVINILDGAPWLFNENKAKLNLPDIAENVKFEDFLYYFKNCRFAVTDSCHGTSFAMVYNKPFISIGNRRRGISRFKSLLSLARLENRFVTDPGTIINNPDLLKDIDYAPVNEIFAQEKTRSLNWLKDAVFLEKKEKEPAPVIAGEIQAKPTTPLKLHPDIERCRILVALLRDYGIKHFVLSSGTRNISIVRLIEGNVCFVTYNIADERSAAHFALGLALKLGETVGICCTSGTAACNYLPAVTEAFYQKIPLVVVTADRYPCLLDQMEDQTILQVGMFDKVCKKSVTLPINGDALGKWETRRLVSEALLEVNHHGTGPVHINVPIAHIERTPPPPQMLALPKMRHIDRICLSDTERIWDQMAGKLNKYKKILIVYGQSRPLGKAEQAAIDAFAEKYKCVILTDHLSNFHSGRSVHAYNLMRKYTNDQFKELLAPDLVITVGGKRILNCPVQPKLRAMPGSLPVWRVAEDGSLTDLYRKLTAIFECPPQHFFTYFADKPLTSARNDDYLNIWQAHVESLPVEPHTKHPTLYTIGELMKNLPNHSSIHLAVGNTFVFAQRFPLGKSITVYCNMGVNGIDGCSSTFMGHAAVSDELSFLLTGDLSFFYDMNSLYGKQLKGNIRILLNNDSGAGLLKHLKSPGVTQHHVATAKGWVESLGFKYLRSHNKEEFDALLPEFLVQNSDKPIFFEALS